MTKGEGRPLPYKAGCCITSEMVETNRLPSRMALQRRTGRSFQCSGKKIQLVGDDLFVTNTSAQEEGH